MLLCISIVMVSITNFLINLKNREVKIVMYISWFLSAWISLCLLFYIVFVLQPWLSSLYMRYTEVEITNKLRYTFTSFPAIKKSGSWYTALQSLQFPGLIFLDHFSLDMVQLCSHNCWSWTSLFMLSVCMQHILFISFSRSIK